MHKIKKQFCVYALLLIFALAQVFFIKRLSWFPDLILLMVVFGGIFGGSARGAWVGLIAGFFRGCFSPETFLVDIVIFPVAGLLSSAIASRIYRQNPVAQVFISAIAVVMVVVTHATYLNVISGNDIGISLVFIKSWKTLTATVFCSPLMFAFLDGALRPEEGPGR